MFAVEAVETRDDEVEGEKVDLSARHDVVFDSPSGSEGSCAFATVRARRTGASEISTGALVEDETALVQLEKANDPCAERKRVEAEEERRTRWKVRAEDLRRRVRSAECRPRLLRWAHDGDGGREKLSTKKESVTQRRVV